MTTFRTVEARVWEVGTGHKRKEVLAILGRVFATDSGGHVVYQLTEHDCARDERLWQRAMSKTLSGQLSAAIIEAIDYAFPGCATAGEGGAS